MKKLIFILLLFACSKEPDEYGLIHMSASGSGRFEAGWNIGIVQSYGYKIWVQDSWSDSVALLPGDTLYLAAFSNDSAVTLTIENETMTVMPNSYGRLQFIVK